MGFKKKYSIDEFKDRMDSPVFGWDVEKEPKKKTAKKTVKGTVRKGKTNGKAEKGRTKSSR